MVGERDRDGVHHETGEAAQPPRADHDLVAVPASVSSTGEGAPMHTASSTITPDAASSATSRARRTQARASSAIAVR